MKLADLSQETLEKIEMMQWDRITENYEGLWGWESVLRSSKPDFLIIDEHPVLLPVDCGYHSNITILRTIWSADNRSLTLLLRDVTCRDKNSRNDKYIAICNRIAGEDFFLAILYHEWFLIDQSAVFPISNES